MIEVVIYVTILSLLTVVAVSAILAVNTYLATIRVVRLLSDTETLAMERVIRTVRDAASVNVGASVFDSSPGTLSLTGSESPPLAHIVSLSGGTLFIQDGTAPAEALTPPGVAVTGLIFGHLTNGTLSEAVKVELTLAASSGKATTTHNVYGTAVLRNSYD